jgi:hypothetical protein
MTILNDQEIGYDIDWDIIVDQDTLYWYAIKTSLLYNVFKWWLKPMLILGHVSPNYFSTITSN